MEILGKIARSIVMTGVALWATKLLQPFIGVHSTITFLIVVGAMFFIILGFQTVGYIRKIHYNEFKEEWETVERRREEGEVVPFPKKEEE
jgi:hypothetical protein